MASESEEFGDNTIVLLQRIARELAMLRQLCTTAVNYLRDAEAEVPEKMRRYMNYMHDVHDIKYMYEEQGQDVPQHVLRELERLDDRYRQLLSELTFAGGTFDKVRREMAADPKNRWDHTKQLAAPTHKPMEKEE